ENKDFYILNRGNILKTSSSDSIYDFNISEQHDLYNYLKVYSNKKLNNIYLIGGYNGTIKVFSKKEKEIIGNYFIKYKNKNLVVYDIFIDKNNLYILADNYLIIFNKFVENDFRLIKNNIDYDLLEESLKSLSLGKLKLPLDNGSSLPLHSSVYPGARRLYRTGVHEGIDFFENVTTKTPVISSKKGIVLRVDKNYKEIDKKKYDNILKESNSQGYTPPDIEDLLRGRQVVLKHDNNLITVYAHLSKVNEDLELNQEIDENDILGYVGNSGTKDGVNHSTKGLHLHFEVHINDKSKKLEYYLGKYLTIEETMQIYQKIISN
ncbi:MAG: M23 family metallopeptidase, partial [Candidatus Sericytochromatia bacterium]